MSKKILLYCIVSTFSMGVASAALIWEDIGNSPWPIAGPAWTSQNEVRKAEFLELYSIAISYCQTNLGKASKDLNGSISGPRVSIFPRVTLETIAMLYREYGDLQKAAKTKHQHWRESKGNLDLLSADGNSDIYVIDGYEEAGMYKEALRFYNIAYEHMLQRLSIGTDVKLLKTNLREYEQNWPEEAAIYNGFVKSWRETKKLAKTTKPKPLDPAVQHHEWFYSDKQEEVLKALAYYHKHNVGFMLEKASKHKDSVIAAKAKEYLQNPVKEVAGDETKK